MATHIPGGEKHPKEDTPVLQLPLKPEGLTFQG